MPSDIKLNELNSRKTRATYGSEGVRTFYSGFDLGSGVATAAEAAGQTLDLVPSGNIYAIAQALSNFEEQVEQTVKAVRDIPKAVKDAYEQKVDQIQAAVDAQISRLPADLQNVLKIVGRVVPKGVGAAQALVKALAKFGGAALRTCGFLLVGSVSVGWILFKIFTLDFSSLWGAFTQGVNALWNFNFSVSDKDIEEQVNSMWNSFGSLLGGTLGNLVGFTACGALPGSALLVLNEGLAMTVLKEVGEEAFQEFIGNLSNLSMSLWRAAASTTMLWAYKDIRRAVKFPGNPFGKALKGIMGEEKFKKWGQDGSESFTFGSTFETFVEKIPLKFLENFIEEFFEEATDSCVEAGFIVTNTVESQLKLTTDAISPLFGQPTLVELVMNRRELSEDED